MHGDAYRVWLLYSFCARFFFGVFAVVASLYRIQTASLDPLQLVLVGTALELSVFSFETPTGVLADVRGRKVSVVLGTVMIGAGFAFEGLVASFGTILVAQVIWGVGYTFTSGATEAWLAGEIGEERLDHAFMRGAQASGAGIVLGMLTGGALTLFGLRLPLFFAGAGTAALGLWLALRMPETGFVRDGEDRRGPIAIFRSGVRSVRGHPVLLALIGAALFHGLSSEGFDRLWEAHILATHRLPALGPLPSTAWFGVFGAAATVLGIGGVEVARRRLAGRPPTVQSQALVGLGAVHIAFTLGFAFAPHVAVAVGCFLAKGIVRAAAGPVERSWLTRRADPRYRATVVSLAGQTDAFGQFAGGPAVGFVGRMASIRAAIGLSALLFAPALGLYTRAGRKETDDAQDVAPRG